MTAGKLAAENARLREENQALRDLLAVIAGARQPYPARDAEMHLFCSAGSDRLLRVTLAAAHALKPGGHASAADAARFNTESLRQQLAMPLQYEAEAAQVTA